MLCRQPQRLDVQLDYWSDIDHRDAGAPVAVRQALEQCSIADTKSTSVATAVKACRQVVGDVACCDDPNADGDVWTAVLLRSSDVPRDEHSASAVDLMRYCDFTMSGIMDNCHAARTKHAAALGSVEHMGDSSRVRGRLKLKQMQRRGGDSARLE